MDAVPLVAPPAPGTGSRAAAPRTAPAVQRAATAAPGAPAPSGQAPLPPAPLPPVAVPPQLPLPTAAVPPSAPARVQRSAAPGAVPLRALTPPGAATASSPLPVASLTPPPVSAPEPSRPVQSGSASAPAVQRFGNGSSLGALASAAAGTVTSALGRMRSHRSEHTTPTPYEPPSGGPPPGSPPPYSPPAGGSGVPPANSQLPTDDSPPGYTAVPAGGFDPRELTDFQLDELVHRIIGRVTRLVRTELRMDRERIGRLRDPRH